MFIIPVENQAGDQKDNIQRAPPHMVLLSEQIYKSLVKAERNGGLYECKDKKFDAGSGQVVISAKTISLAVIRKAVAVGIIAGAAVLRINFRKR